MDLELSDSMSEIHFEKAEDGGTGPMQEGQDRLESQSDQGQGQFGSSEMIQSVGPDEEGESLLVEEVDSIPQKQAVKTFRASLPKVVISEVFDLKEILKNIDKCARYRYIVVNATADKDSVHIKTQNELFDVLKHCDAISLIVQNFQSGASNILEKLRIACLVLQVDQDGLPDFAMVAIESTSEDVAMMREGCGKTLEKVPGDLFPSMDTCVTMDFEQRRSDLPEGIVMDDSFVASDDMQRSFEAIQEGSNEIDEFRRRVDEDKAKQLKDMTDATDDDRLEQLQSDTPEDETVYTSDEGMAMVYVPPIEKVLEMMAGEGESKRHYFPIALMKRAINVGWMGVKDTYIVTLYKYHGYKEPLAITNAEDSESQSSDAENRPTSVPERQVPDPDVLDKIDSYMRAKLTSVIVEIVKELYNNIRNIIKDALDLTEKWYQECKTLVEPAMKFNLEKTCDPEFAIKAEAYLDRWRLLRDHCDSHRKDIRKLRQTVEGYYIDNPYPREAVKASWKLAAEEQEERIRKVVEEWRSYMSAEADGAE